MSMMRPRLLIAAYHPASGTERAYSGAGLAEMAAGAAGARGVGGAKQLVALYKAHDVLQEVLDEARRDLQDPKDLPGKPPESC